MALLQSFWSHAPIEEVRGEYERRVGLVRMKRRNDFIDSLLEEGSSSYQQEEMNESGKKQVEVESDEDDDHPILEWETRRYGDMDLSQYGSFLQEERDHNMEADDGQADLDDVRLGKRSREEFGDDVIDKYPVGKMRMSAEFDGLKKIQDDYGQEMEAGGTPRIDRGAVGPVPPDAP
ncbi:hypothetical protein HA466_0156070 [Hirschfeldia incana]|nr:hypothetical protein HA466_0156070 [Hirschfeldia incana]